MAASSVSGAGTSTRSASVADSHIEPFLQPDFDPATYLNNALPSLSTSSSSRTGQNTHTGRSVPLVELSSQLQSFLSQLNAQTSRLSNDLTRLTDEIIRSGGRLAYEVDVLRGETVGLTDALEDGLKKDIGLFTLPSGGVAPSGQAENGCTAEPSAAEGEGIDQPDHLDRLKTLTSVRARLDAVVKVFGDCMEWSLAPSELSTVSSLISVSGPGAGQDTRSREEKGSAYAEKLRNEIGDMIGSGDDASDFEAAAARIEHMRLLAEVWKGTSEEKARLRFVESLQKVADEKQKALGRPANSRPTALPIRGADYRYGDMGSNRPSNEAGYGFLQNLRNL